MSYVLVVHTEVSKTEKFDMDFFRNFILKE